MAESERSHVQEDDRIIRENGIDARVAAIVAPVLRGAGYRLVRVRVTAQNGQTLQIMAERPDGTMTVEDCEEASRALSPVLDVEDPLSGHYNLEISSPGIDRPLVRKADFEAGAGHLVKLETAVLVAGRKRFRGHILSVDGDAIMLKRDQPPEGEDETVAIPLHAIADARLILTDELIRDALTKDKKLRQALKDGVDIEMADDEDADDI